MGKAVVHFRKIEKLLTTPFEPKLTDAVLGMNGSFAKLLPILSW